jgi:hypothetical protein
MPTLCSQWSGNCSYREVCTWHHSSSSWPADGTVALTNHLCLSEVLKRERCSVEWGWGSSAGILNLEHYVSPEAGESKKHRRFDERGWVSWVNREVLSTCESLSSQTKHSPWRSLRTMTAWETVLLIVVEFRVSVHLLTAQSPYPYNMDSIIHRELHTVLSSL